MKKIWRTRYFQSLHLQESARYVPVDDNGVIAVHEKRKKRLTKPSLVCFRGSRINGKEQVQLSISVMLLLHSYRRIPQGQGA